MEAYSLRITPNAHPPSESRTLPDNLGSGSSGPLTCEDLQADLGEGCQRGLVEHADIADLPHLSGVDTAAPNRPQDVPNGS